MLTIKKAYPLHEIAVRAVGDLVMVSMAFAAAMFVRYLFETSRVLGGGHSPYALAQYMEGYLQNFWILGIVSLVVFSASGFYTRGRYYQGKYKALVIAQAVGLSYLFFGCLAWLSQAPLTLLPRSALFIGCLFTIGLLIVARFWSMLWRKLEGSEAGQIPLAKKRTRRVLVIGGAGYIGSALLPKLLAQGYQVRLLDLFIFGMSPVAKFVNHPNLEVIRADFRQVDSVVKAMKDVDDVIHLGAIVGDQACALDEELTVEVNLEATRMIAEVAKGSGATRLYFASTCSVYGANDQILDERSELNPISLYAQSKLACERVLLKMADDSFSPVIFRFGTVYGLSGRTRFDLVVNLLTAKAVKEKKMTLFGGGQWRPFLHVDDAALAFMKAVQAPSELSRGQIFNVGSNAQNYQLAEAAKIIQSLTAPAEISDTGATTDFRNYRVDFTKIAKMLDYAPHWTLQDGVKQVITALNSGEITDYHDPMYSNAKFLEGQSDSRPIRRENGWASELIASAVKLKISPSVGFSNRRGKGGDRRLKSRDNCVAIPDALVHTEFSRRENATT